jgi:hypothetical protein
MNPDPVSRTHAQDGITYTVEISRFTGDDTIHVATTIDSVNGKAPVGRWTKTKSEIALYAGPSA